MSGIYTIPSENALQSTLDAQLAAGATSMTLADDWSSYFSGLSATNPAVLVIDRQDANSTDTPAKREYVLVTNVSGATFTISTRGLNGSTDQVHSVGARVEAVVDVATWGSLKTTFETNHDSTDGSHGALTADSITLASGATPTEFSIDGTMAGNSDTAVPTEKATKTYVDGKIIDEDDFASDSATQAPSQQSVKAYVDTTAKARAYRTTTQSINNAAATKVQLDGESYDVGSNFDNATNYRFVAPVTGYYMVVGSVAFDDLADGKQSIAYIYVNGSPVTQARTMTAGATEDTETTVSDIIYLTASQYVELYCLHNHGSARNLKGGSALTFLAVHLLSR